MCHRVLGECRIGLIPRRAVERLIGWNKMETGQRKTLENNFLYHLTFMSGAAVSSQAWLSQDFLHPIADSHPAVICSRWHQELTLTKPDDSAPIPMKYCSSHGNAGRAGQQSGIGSSGGGGSVFRSLGPALGAKFIKPAQQAGCLAVLRMPTWMSH